MESVLWSCTFIFAGLIAVVNAQCISTNVLFRIDASPISSTVATLNDVTLTCLPTAFSIRPEMYSWHRVNGKVPSHSSGQNTDTLTIHRVVPADEGQYYCMATAFGHCAVSDNVMVTVEVIGATVRFDQVAYTVSEVDGRSEPALILSNPSSTVITLQVFSTDGSATGRGIDYNSGPYTVQFNAGDMRASFNVSINNDNILEGNETFNLTVNASSLPNSVTVGDPGKTTVTIVDNDMLRVEFDQRFFNGSEVSGYISITLSLRGGTSIDNITVTVIPHDRPPHVSSAEGNRVDYDSSPLTATFTAGSTNTTVNVPVIKDNIAEVSERFSLNFSIPSSLEGRVIPGMITQSFGIIIDNTITAVKFSQSTYRVNEYNGSVQPILVLSNPSSTNITINVSTANITAFGGGTDYDSRLYTITIPAGETSISFNIPINNDIILERNESFYLDINSFILSDRVNVTTPNHATVTIVDDDVLSVEFDQMVYSGSEASGFIPVTLLLRGGTSSYSITVTVIPSDQSPVSAEGNGVDYDSTPLSVTFSAGSNSTIVNVPVINDNIAEELEKFDLSFTIPSSLESRVISGAITKAVGNITDNATTTVKFSQSTYRVNESRGVVQPVLVLSNPSSTDITIEVLNTDITAVGRGVDYDSGLYTVIIPAKQTSMLFGILINDDSILEGSESFNLTISTVPHHVIVTNPNEATVTIVDDDVLSVEFAQMIYSGSEASGFISVILLLRGGTSSDDITVTVIPSDQSPVSAEGNGVDYDSTPLSVTFSAGSNSTIVNVPVTNDDIAEELEKFDLNFIIPSSLEDQVVSGAIIKAVGNITDNTTTTVKFSQSTYRVNESRGVVQPVLVLSNPSSTDITIEVLNTDITAVGGGVDYDSGLYTVIIPAKQTSMLFGILINDDSILEGSESFNLTISTVSHHVIVTNPSEAIVTIVDDDVLSVEFAQMIYSGSEASGFISVILLLRGGTSSDDITVTVIPSDQSPVSAEGNGVDYDSAPLNATFTAGSTSTIVNVPVNEDDVSERSEAFDLSFTIPSSLKDRVISGTIANAIVNITDNITTTVRFSRSSYRVNERRGSVQPMLVLSNPLSTDITIEVFNMDITAFGGGVDYDSGPYTVTVPAGETSTSFNVSITNDDISERTENLNLIINASSIPDYVIVINPNQARVTIVDNDDIRISFNQSTYNVSENGGMVKLVLTLSNPSSRNISLQMRDSEGSAIKGQDYIGGPYSVEIPAGQKTYSFIVPIINDTTVEENENFAVIIAPRSLPNYVTRTIPVRTTVTVIDNDCDLENTAASLFITISFNQSAYSVVEGNGPVQPVLVLSSPLPGDITVTVQITDKNTTAIRGDVDYMSGPYTVMFSAGETIASFDVSVINDNILESDEQFILIIDPSSLPRSIVVGIIDNSTITILDGEAAATIFFNQSMYSVDENNGSVQPVLVLSNPSSTDITVQVIDIQDTARGGGDYISGTYNVTFFAGHIHAVFDVPIRDDTTVENNENFILAIISDSLPNKINTTNPDRTRVTIIDNDDSTVFFSQLSYSVTENDEAAQLVLRLSNPLSSDINVQVNDNGNTATSGDDYDSGPYNITFTAGMTSTPLIISIINDSVFEDNENFFLTINSVPSIITVGGSYQATVTIVDDEVIMVQFSNATYSGSEESGAVPVTLLLEGGTSPFVITVTVIPSDQSPVSAEGNGVDYSSTSINTTFEVGSANTTISVPVTRDSIIETAETFNISLMIPSSLSNRVLLGKPNVATGSIVDSTVASVSFNQPTYSVNESDGMVQLVLLLSNQSTTDITVQVIDSDNSAMRGGKDYIGPYNVTFPAGITQIEFTVPINDDDVVEDKEESFSLSINLSSLPKNTNAGDPDHATIIIVDDDVRTVQFSKSTFFGSEVSGFVNVTLLLQGGPSSAGITVIVNTSDQSPLSAEGDGVDYISSPIHATFAPGTTSTTINIPVINDSIAEVSETFVLNLVILSNEVFLGETTTAIGTITDNTVLMIRFSQPAYYGDETSGGIHVTLLLEGGSSTDDITVTVMPSDQSPVSAQGNGVDYNSTEFDAIFPAGATDITVNIPVIIDDIVEESEMFNLTLTISSSLNDKVILGNVIEATGIITDNTNTTVRFAKLTYSVSESDKIVRTFLVISNPSSFDITIQVLSSDLTTNEHDYVSGPHSVIFPAGVIVVSLNISIVDDSLLENDEEFVLIIGPFQPPRVVVSNLHQATITIMDNDGITVFFNQSAYSVNENDGPAQPVLVLSNPSSINITVIVISTDYSANGRGVDYIPGPYEVIFYAGVTEVLIPIPIVDDTILENNEDFFLTILDSSLSNNVSLGVNFLSTITIVDDDVVIVSFGQQAYSVDEYSGSIQTTIELNVPSSIDITIEVIDNEDTASDKDYVSGSQSVTIPAGWSIADIFVSIIDDKILEDNETFDLMIATKSLPDGLILGNPNKTKITIIDDENATIFFNESTYSVNEYDGSAQFVLVLSNPVSTAFTVVVETDSAATAIGGEDYGIGPYNVTFMAEETYRKFNVSINSDSLLEGNESVDFIITSDSLPNKIILGNPFRTTLNILDDDDTTVFFNQSTYSATESDGQVQLAVLITNPSSTDITVQVLSTNVSATEGRDYVSGPYNVTFAAGVKHGDFNVTINDDKILEINEIFTLSIHQPSLPTSVNVGNLDQVTVTILDDDVITVNFDQNTYKVNEADRYAQLVLIFDNPSSTDVNVTVFSDDRSATGGNVDYDFGSHNVTFTSEMIRVLFNVSITNDNILENEENFIIAIDQSSLPNGVSVGNGSQARVEIVDDDIITVSFNESLYNVNEESELVQPVLILNHPSSTDITIKIRDRQYTAKRGVDFASGIHTAVFPAGSLFTYLNVSVTNDDIFEDKENFALIIMATRLPKHVSLGEVNRTTVTIFDVVNVNFEEQVYNVDESQGAALVSVVLSHPLKRGITFTVKVGTKDISATQSDKDYKFRPYSLTFTTTVRKVSFRVSIVDDDKFEGNEYFNLTIDSSSLPSGVIVAYPSETSVVISDGDDAPSVMFEQSMYTVNENDVIQPVLVLSNPSSIDISVQVSTTDGSATGYVESGSGLDNLQAIGNDYTDADMDYDSGPYSITFIAGDIRVTFNVTVTDDNVFEGKESFTLTINPNSLPKSVVVDDPRNATVTIVDNDAPTVRFRQPTYSVHELDEFVEIELVLSNPLTINITVRVVAIDGSATGYVDGGSGLILGNEDYDTEMSIVTFYAGEKQKLFTVQVTDDDIFEDNENFTLTIDSSLLPSDVMIGNPNQVTVTIIDDDAIDVFFNQSSYNVSEDSKLVQPVLVFSNPSSYNVTVKVVATNDSATGGEDYLSGPYLVEFDAGTTRVPFDVLIINDNVSEGNEGFTLTIDHFSLPIFVSVDDRNQTTVNIVDDDVTAVFFNQSTYSFMENDRTAEFILILSKPSSKDITVEVVNNDITAVGGDIDYGSAMGENIDYGSAVGGVVDYGSGPYNVTFPAGQVYAVFYIIINDDNIVENSEMFNLTISSFSLPSEVNVSKPDQVTVTIEDNDVAAVYFNQSTYYVDEDDGQVQAVLVLSNPSSTDLTVEIADSSNTAMGGGDDYGSVPYNVTFSSGLTSASFNVLITNDDILEENESFILNISSSSLLVDDPGEATVFIIDDDAITVFFNKSSYTVKEESELVQLVLVLSAPSSRDITVNVSNINNLSAEDADYGSGPYSIIFNAGVTSVLFNISIVNDNVSESNENFILAIDNSSLPDRVGVSDLNQATVTIVDDDVVVVYFMESTYSTTENNGVAQIVLVLTKPSATIVTVQVVNNDDTAVGGRVDYNSGPYTVTFPAGSTNVAFNVSINDDDMLEGNESFNLTINSALPSEVNINDPAQIIVTIVDDEVGTISFQLSTYTINENDNDPLQPVLVLSHPLSMDITVQVIDKSSTALGGVDYDAGPYTVIFPAGVTQGSFSISANNDMILEDNENFTLIINSSSVPNYVNSFDQATVIIVDDEVATVFFSRLSYNVKESDGSVELRLILSNPSSTNITVMINEAGKTATVGEDYSSGPYTAVIPAGMTDASFSVNITNDNILERKEEFNLAIDQRSLPFVVTAIDPSQVTVTIMDDDSGVNVSFNHSYTINENDRMVQPVIVLSNPSSFGVRLRVRDASMSARRNNDYDRGPYRIVIPAGQIHVRFNVSIMDDNVPEGNETFQLFIAPGSLHDDFRLGTLDRITITIVDDDNVASVSFNQSTYSVNENDGTMQLVLVLNNSIFIDVTMLVGYSNNTATGGNDYIATSYNITIPSQTTHVLFNISIIDDNILEDTENFTVTIMSSQPSITVNTPDQTTIIIVDDDVLSVEFDQMIYSGSEASGFIPVTLLLKGGTSTDDITVIVIPSDQSPVSAEGNVDYNSTAITAIFTAGSNSTMINVPVIEDKIVEELETFDLTFTIPSSLKDQVIRGAITKAVVDITDNTITMVRFNESSYRVNEDSGPIQPVLVLSNPSSTDTTVEVFNNNITALGRGVDYASGPYTVIIPAGEISVPFDVPITDDNVLEGNENFNLTINVSSLHSRVIPTSPYEATVIIVDNDVVSVFFNQSTYSVNENDGTIQLVIVLNSSIFIDVTVLVGYSNNTAIGGYDYIGTLYNVTIPSQTTHVLLNVSIIDDDMLEDTENFTVTIMSSQPRIAVNTPDQTTIIIVDDDVAMVNFEQSIYSVNESSELIQPVLVLNSSSSFSITVQVTYSNSTTTGGVDYVSGTFAVTFPAENTRVVLNMSIIDNDILETNKLFNLTIDQSSLPSKVVVGDHYQTSVVIVDDDDISVYFSQPTYRVNENDGAVQLVLVLSNPSSTDFDVEIRDNEGTAIRGDDYVFESKIVRLHAGTIRASFSVMINNDSMPEYKENLYFTINSSLPIGITLGTPNQTTVTIVDDDVVNLIIGESIKVEVDEQIIIDCGPHIKATGVHNPNITWYLNGVKLVNESTPNVLISQDEKLCIITETSLSFGGQLGNAGNYTCKVCSNLNTCMSNSSIIDVCGEPNLMPPSSPPLITLPFVAALTCGQNVTLPSTGVGTLSISCMVFNGSDPITTEVFKNGVSIGSSFLFTIHSFGDDDFGNYTFVASTKKCGSTSAVSWILQDIDECEQGSTACDHNCTNTAGSYFCSCWDGYELESDNHTCTDIDECVQGPAECDHNCTNTAGSYFCSCMNGYELESDNHTCTDINECVQGPAECNHNCTNTAGSYFCSCWDGYELESDNHTCTDIDECVQGPAECDHNCTNTAGSYFCSCWDGYELESDNRSCTDIDECVQGLAECDHNCTNTAGSYFCSCLDGYELESDNHTCIARSCEVNKISGDLKVRNNRKVRLTFSADHPDALFECKVNNKMFMNCTSPQNFNRNIGNVVVRAYCIIDGKLQPQKRRKFVNRFN